MDPGRPPQGAGERSRPGRSQGRFAARANPRGRLRVNRAGPDESPKPVSGPTHEHWLPSLIREHWEIILTLVTGMTIGVAGTCLACFGNPHNSGICVSCYLEN